MGRESGLLVQIAEADAGTISDVIALENLLLQKMDVPAASRKAVDEFSQRTNKALLKVLMQYLGFQQASYSQFLFPAVHEPKERADFRAPTIQEYCGEDLWCVPIAIAGEESMGKVYRLNTATNRGLPTYHASRNPEPIVFYNDPAHIQDLINKGVISARFYQALQDSYKEESKNPELLRKHPTFDSYVYTVIFPQIMKKRITLPNGKSRRYIIAGCFMFDSPVESFDVKRPLPKHKLELGQRITSLSSNIVSMANQFRRYARE